MIVGKITKIKDNLCKIEIHGYIIFGEINNITITIYEIIRKRNKNIKKKIGEFFISKPEFDFISMSDYYLTSERIFGDEEENFLYYIIDNNAIDDPPTIEDEIIGYPDWYF